MKRLLSILYVLLLLFCLSPAAFAEGDPNIDGGGGSMGDGTNQSYWSPGKEGVRITIIRDSDNTSVSMPIDFSNINTADVQVHFGKVSKVSYRGGQSLTAINGAYSSIKPAQAMPRIISSSGGNNIEAIRNYFCRSGTIQDIASATGFDYEELINGEYKILLEPIAYYKYNGIFMGMTAHEASLYDQLTGSKLRRDMGALTAQNLPLAMFLETPDLGYPAWAGPKNQYVSNGEIQSALGLGIVRFSEPDEPPAQEADYIYRCNTEVITAVTVSTKGRQRTPDNPVNVSFRINGRTYTHSDIYLPEYDSQLAWVKWITPKEPCTITITVSSNATVDTSTITATIIDLDDNVPPDPTANDRNDGFRIPAPPSVSDVRSLTWGEWDCWWHEYWVWHGSRKDGYWCDHGWWEYDWLSYNASITATMSVQPDEKVPTASGKIMKSGYGFNMEAAGRLRTSAPSSHLTPLQNVITYFPEFKYKTYCRLLERMSSGYTSTYEFKKNEYSTYNQRSHFTPVWFPDGRYVVYAQVLDAWTPAGMLQINLTDTITIRDNLFSDWHIGPIR